MAQIEFFSTIEDEIKLISQIAKEDSIKYSVIQNNTLTEWLDLNDLIVPDPDTKFEICIRKTDYEKELNMVLETGNEEWEFYKADLENLEKQIRARAEN